LSHNKNKLLEPVGLELGSSEKKVDH